LSLVCAVGCHVVFLCLQKNNETVGCLTYDHLLLCTLAFGLTPKIKSRTT